MGYRRWLLAYYMRLRYWAKEQVKKKDGGSNPGNFHFGNNTWAGSRSGQKGSDSSSVASCVCQESAAQSFGGPTTGRLCKFAAQHWYCTPGTQQTLKKRPYYLPPSSSPLLPSSSSSSSSSQRKDNLLRTLRCLWLECYFSSSSMVSFRPLTPIWFRESFASPSPPPLHSLSREYIVFSSQHLSLSEIVL